MDFLNQIPQVLLGRPTTGVGDFLYGAGSGLLTGDSGSFKPGLLASLGRLAAIASAQSPTEALRIKTVFDAQDAQKRDALSSPMAQQMTPQQFEQAMGFTPPTKITGGPGAYTGGRAKVAVDALPTDPRQMADFMTAKGRVDAAQSAPNPYAARQVLERGFSAQERTAMSQEEFDRFSKQNAIDPREYAIEFQTQPDGSILKGYVRRGEMLMSDEDINEITRTNNLDPRYFQTIRRLAGFGAGGEPLYDINILNKPREPISRSLPNPIREVYWAVLEETGDPMKAAEAAGEIARKMSVSGGSGAKKDFATQLEEAHGVKFTPQEKIVINRNEKGYMVPLKPSEEMFRKEGQKDSTQIVDEIVEAAKSRSIGAEQKSEAPRIEKVEPVSTEQLGSLVDAAIQEVAEGISQSPDQTISLFADNLARSPEFAGIPAQEKLKFASRVISGIVRDPGTQIQYVNRIAKALGL